MSYWSFLNLRFLTNCVDSMFFNYCFKNLNGRRERKNLQLVEVNSQMAWTRIGMPIASQVYSENSDA